MYQQTVKGRQVSPKQGVLLVACVAVSITCANYVAAWLEKSTGFTWGSSILWLITGIVAVRVMRDCVADYRYTFSDDTLYLARKLGEHAKILVTAPRDAVLAIGPEAEIREKYPDASPVERLGFPGGEPPLLALAYRREKGVSLALFQPDATLLARLRDERQT